MENLSMKKRPRPLPLDEVPFSSSVRLFDCTGSTPSDLDCTVSLNSLQDEIDSRFAPKKVDSRILGKVYQNLDLQSRAIRVFECGSFLEFSVGSASSKLFSANFCKDRLCPMCNWRRSLKIFSQVSSVMDVLEKEGYQFLFLTLTVRNCSGDELPDVVQTIYDGWRNLYHENKVFKKSVVGTFRSLEVTRNHNTGLFHPHLHVILVCRPDYFKGNNYINHKKWVELWQFACGLDYSPVVHIEKIKDNGKGVSGAAAEVAKYAVKASDLFAGGDLEEISQYVSSFLNSLSGRRLCGFTGVFAKVRKQLKLDDIEKGNLVNVTDELRPDVASLIVRYHWKNGAYVRSISPLN